MELTAKTLQEVTFGAKVRGYDPAEVDDFIAAVAEGVEELHERLRRATERATRAEQQLAAAPAAEAAAPVEAVATSSGSPEISKVWERAVAAAEQAMEEAKSEAQRLLDEARTRADSQLNDARREADSTIANARSEAARIQEEAEGKLLAEIARLESSRDSLNHDVAGLSNFLEGERNRLRAHLNEALAQIEKYGSESGAAPFVEPAPSNYGNDAAPAATTASDDWAASTSTTTSVAEPAWPTREDVVPAEPEAADDSNDADDQIPSWASYESTDSTQEETAQTDDSQTGTVDVEAEAEGDPFLAELRRAVQDDGPLGPRAEEGEDAISDLYASDDDSSGFFRRNK